MIPASEAARVALRTAHRVRVVEPDEEGSAAADLPPGVYGFTGSAGLAAPLFAARRYRNFEIHHLHDGDIAIIGFVTPADAERLRAAHAPLELTVYPDSEGSAAEIVAISYSRIAQHRQYSIRNTPGLVLHVSPELATT
jgi:hypothetical protein